MQRGLWRDCRRHAMLRRMQDDAQEKTKTAKRRGPKKATPKYLERVALWYLDRWAGSSGNLRRILMKRVEASARAHETDREEGQRSVEAIITRLRDTGLLNDRLVAESKARSQFAKGQPLGAIARKLHQQVLEDEDISVRRGPPPISRPPSPSPAGGGSAPSARSRSALTGGSAIWPLLAAAVSTTAPRAASLTRTTPRRWRTC